MLPLVLLIIVLAGCKSAPDRVEEIRYMAWGNPEQLAVEQQMCDAFMQLNPDVRVRLFRVPQSSYLDKMTLMLASRTAPDVVRVDQYYFPSLVRKNYFYNLSPLAAADPTFRDADFYPHALNEGKHNGDLYALNVLMGGIMVYYNKNAVKAAGLEDPYALAQRNQWTWDTFRRYAIAMTKNGPDGRPEQFGLLLPSATNLAQMAPTLWGFGGNFLDGDGKTCRLDTPEAARALQFLADLRWEDKAAPTPSQGALSAFTFESGKVGMVLDWMGLAPRLRKNVKDFEWDICPVPSGPRGNATVIKGNQLAMYRETAHPQAAWRFMRFLTSPETEQMLYGELRRGAPTRRAVALSPAFLEAKEPPFNTRVYLSAVERGRPLPITARWQQWTTEALAPELDNLWSGRERDARVVLKRATEKVNAVLADEEGF